MAGFTPVGSTPVASAEVPVLAGSYIAPAVGVLTLEGSTNSNLSVVPVRVYEVAAEVLEIGAPQVRINEIAAEVMTPGVSYARINEIAAEVMSPGVSYVNINEIAAEVLRSVTGTLASTGGGFVSIIW